MKEEVERKAARDQKDGDKEMKSEETKEEGKEGEEKSNKQAPNSGNGGQTDTYRWTQTLEELTVYVPMPDDIVSKQLDVVIKSTHLKIGLKGQTPIIDGELHKKIKSGDSLWTLEKDGSKRTIQLTL